MAAAGAAAVALLAPAAASADRYAAPGGDGPDPCVAADPCAIGPAVEGPGVTTGETIHLAPGDYEVTDSLWLGNRVTVLGQPGVTITSTIGGDTTVYVTPGTHMADVRIFAGSAQRALDIAGSGERLTAVAEDADAACVVRLFKLNPGPVPFFRDSVCHATGAGSKAIDLMASCGEPAPVEANRSAIVNVTAVAEGTSSRGIHLRANHGCKEQFDLLNVIAQGEGADIAAVTFGEPASQARVLATASAYDDVFTDGAGAFVTPTGSGANITAEPLFVDPAAGDFRQAFGSPTIDAGRLGDHLGASDFEGEARPQGKRYDIGADEADSDPPVLRTPGSLALKRNGVVPVKLRCTASELSPPCRGKLKLQTRGKVDFRGKRRKLTLAATSFAMGAPAAKTVRLRLSRAKADLVRGQRAARKVRAIVVARDSLGNRARSVALATIKPR